MLEDYCQKLQQLNKDKNDFIKLKYKANAKTLVDKQENKYHKYILGQISHKNKLDSLLKLTQVFNQIVRQCQKPAFDLLSQKYCSSKTNDSSFASLLDKNEQKLSNILHESQEKDKFSILKLKSKLVNHSCILMARILSCHEKNEQFKAFRLIESKYSQNKGIENFYDVIQRKIAFQKNAFFHNFLLLKRSFPKKTVNENRDNKSFIFSLNEFSEIIPYTIEEESEELSTSGMRDIEEIDNKFHPESEPKLEDTNLLQSQGNEQKLMLESFEKLKEEVIMMKNLLSEKNKQLKLKDEEIYKTKKEYEKKIESLHDEISSRIEREFLLKDGIPSKSTIKSSKKIEFQNDSYLKELEAQIIGDRSPRGNISEDENLSSQLLQKYMRESFEMREKMDMAREMCEQFEFDTKTQEGQVMIEIIKLLTPEERLNAIVD